MKKTFRCFVVGSINCHSESENFLKFLLTRANFSKFNPGEVSWIQTFPEDVSWRFWHRDMIDHFVGEMTRSNLFKEEEVVKWEKRNPFIKQWCNAQTYLTEKYDDHHHYIKSNAKQAGFVVNVMEVKNEESAAAKFLEVLYHVGALAENKESIKNLANNMADLPDQMRQSDAQLKIKEAQLAALQTANNKLVWRRTIS